MSSYRSSSLLHHPPVEALHAEPQRLDGRQLGQSLAEEVHAGARREKNDRLLSLRTGLNPPPPKKKRDAKRYVVIREERKLKGKGWA